MQYIRLNAETSSYRDVHIDQCSFFQTTRYQVYWSLNFIVTVESERMWHLSIMLDVCYSCIRIQVLNTSNRMHLSIWHSAHIGKYVGVKFVSQSKVILTQNRSGGCLYTFSAAPIYSRCKCKILHGPTPPRG